jgi:hypothetical protein
MSVKRGKNGGLQDVIMAELLESSALPEGHFFDKKDSMTSSYRTAAFA